MLKILENSKKLQMKKILNPNYDEGYLGYPKSSPDSAEFGEVGSGEELELRYALAPFTVTVVYRNSWIWARVVLILGGCFVAKGGRD